ncbi:MAG: thiopeptide-type bacteriocin biosynthesis protein [Arenicella sp.]|jgi:thiopeptide-type bacteriocin biosynthesis protein
MNDSEQRTWTAFHVFLHDSVQQEEFIRGWLIPKVKSISKDGLVDSWFFIRYWDGGPHVRIRLLNLVNQDQFLSELIESAKSYLGDGALTRENYYAKHSFDGSTVEASELSWYNDGEVKEMPYEPEIARYGGPDAVLVHETLFHASSEIALAMIRATKDSTAHRLQLALKQLICSVFAVNADPVALYYFTTFSAEFWRSHAGEVTYANDTKGGPKLVEDIQSIRDEIVNDSMTGALGFWVASLKQGISKLRELNEQQLLWSPIDGSLVKTDDEFQSAVMSMVGSQVHMLNNRLGVTPAYEFLLSSRIRDALASELNMSDKNNDQ